MDHKWGRNVTELGLGGRGITLASRLLASTELCMTNGPVIGSGNCLLVEVPTDASDSYSFYVVGKMPGHPHFPYGWGVEHDEPV